MVSWGSKIGIWDLGPHVIRPLLRPHTYIQPILRIMCLSEGDYIPLDETEFRGRMEYWEHWEYSRPIQWDDTHRNSWIGVDLEYRFPNRCPPHPKPNISQPRNVAHERHHRPHPQAPVTRSRFAILLWIPNRRPPVRLLLLNLLRQSIPFKHRSIWPWRWNHSLRPKTSVLNCPLRSKSPNDCPSSNVYWSCWCRHCLAHQIVGRSFLHQQNQWTFELGQSFKISSLD